MNMNYKVAALCLALLATACQPTQSPTTAVSPARFEIRDFKLDEQPSEYGTTYHGRGTLVAQDEALKKGNFLVWMTVKEPHRSSEDVPVVLILRDGLATIETSAYLNKDNVGKKKVEYIDWKMTGFIRLQEAVLVSGAATPPPQK